MASLFSTYEQQNVAVAREQLLDHHVLFLMPSGDNLLDKEFRKLISSSLSKKHVVISDFSEKVQEDILNSDNKDCIYFFEGFQSSLEKMEYQELQHFIAFLSKSSELSSYIVFVLGSGVSEIDNKVRPIPALFNRLAGLNSLLNKTLHVISRIPETSYMELVMDSLAEVGIQVDKETADAMQSDQKHCTLSYTYVKMFVNRVLMHLQSKQEQKSNNLLLTLKDYETVGTLRYFMEYSGKALLAEAEYFSTLEHIEYVFRSLMIVGENKINKVQLSSNQISLRSGVSVEEVEKILKLSSGENYPLIKKSDSVFFFEGDEYLLHWSDLRKWEEKEVEAKDIYLKYCKLADAYEKGETQLLNGIQLEETDKWQQFNPINLNWALTYHPAFEKVISYLTASQQANQENLQAQERSRSRRLKTAYSIAWASVLGLMVILGFGIWARQQQTKALKAEAMSKQSNREAVKALGIAELRTDEALKAKIVADSAKANAIAEAFNAMQAKKKEEVQKIKAIDAQKQAVVERESANAARDDASKAKDQAVENRKIAEKAEAEAKNNFQEAVRLRIQQEARANALSVFEEYDNNNFIQGRKKATDAYELYKTQGGSQFEKDILNSLFVGLIREDIKKYKEDIGYQPTRMTMNASMDKLAVHGTDGFVRVYDLKNSRKIVETYKPDKINGLAFIDDNIIISQPSLLFLQKGGTKVNLLTSESIGKSIKGFYIMGDKNQIICVSTEDALMLYAYQKDQQLKLIKSVPVNNSANLRKVKSNIYFSSGKSLMVTDEQGSAVKNIISLKSSITAISGSLTSGLIAIGDEEGNLYVVDPKTAEIKSERNKLHLSRISGLQTILSQGLSDILISVGYDGAFNIFYLGESSKNNNTLPTPITLKEHKGWVTSLLINSKTNQAFTCSYDKSIRFWPLIPEQLIYTSTNLNKKTNAK